MNEINYKNINSLQEAKELILKCFNTNDFTNLKNIFINYVDAQKLLQENTRDTEFLDELLYFIIKIDIEKRKLEKIYPKPRSISEIEKISRYLDDLISINTNKYSFDYEIFQIFSSLNEVYDKKLKYKINKKEDEKLILEELNKISDQNLQSLEKLPYYSELIFNNLGPFTMINMYNLDLLTENVFKNIYQKLQNDYNLNARVNENFLNFIYRVNKNFWDSIKIEKINFSEDFLRSINIECFKEFKVRSQEETYRGIQNLNKLNKLSGLKIDFPELEETFDKKYNFKFKEVLKYPTIINSICD